MTEAPAVPVPAPTIAEQAEAAKKRVRAFINRSAAQHLRQMRKEWAAREARA